MNGVIKKLYPGESWKVPLNVRKVKVSIYSKFNKTIASGLNDASFFTSSGYTYAWGLNDCGQLGLNDTNPRSTPVYILSGNPNAYFIAAGGKHTLFASAFSSRNSVGKNTNGQLGDTTVVSKSSPVTITLGTNSLPIVHLAAMENSSFIGSWNGINSGFGLNDHGVLGLNDTTPRSSAVFVSAWVTLLTLIKGFSGGKNHLLGWGISGAGGSGLNTYGQLGDGSTTSKSTPTAVSGGLKWKALSAGADHSLGITNDGKLYAWGRNNVGQLGIDTLATTGTSSPVLVSVPVGVKFEDVSANLDHSYALTMDGKIWAWGGNAHGQLGLGDTVDRSSPALVSSDTKFIQLNGSCGNYRSMAISLSGNIYMWGNGSHGALGNNSTSSLSTPHMVIGDSANATMLIDSSVTESVLIDVDPGATMTLENEDINYFSFGGKRILKTFNFAGKYSYNQYILLEY